MYLENGRDLFRGVMILISAAITYWVDLTAGLALAVFVGVMTLQSVWTDWCPADLILLPLGLKKKVESKPSQHGHDLSEPDVRKPEHARGSF